MTFETRLSLCRFEGVQQMVAVGGEPLALVTDPVTGSTFCIKPGEDLGRALQEFIRNWDRQT